ncbi:MAG: hypothetical protein IT162_15655 [Bryobacterales bacterium]|nr:hypothetical protein [Bryobacterales bacterium]
MGSTLSSTVSRLPSWLLRRSVGGAAKQTDAAAWHLFQQAAAATARYRARPMAAEAVVELVDFFGAHAEFLNPAAEAPAPAKLETCWGEPLPGRALAYRPWFRLEAPVETCVEAAPDAALFDGVGVLAAPAGALAELLSRTPRPAAPDYGMVAFTGVGHAALTQALRDQVWDAWGVPVFEQFRGFQGELLGAECEAFAGLHFDPSVAQWEERGDRGELLLTSLRNLRHPVYRLATGRAGRVTEDDCDCGSPRPRVIWAE